ncbi:RibD family protein [Methanolobus sp. ZRKC2]|uniref:dihydrofolate reductase family protein n=1 Tax=Methanolobus sp. ZRKC2 TaxID=3125783 RepID=UPI00324C63FA
MIIMLPEIIMHNTISLDGTIKEFDIDLDLHYQILSSFNPDATLVGSVTAKTGIEMFIENIPQEESSDFTKPPIEENGDSQFCNPYWIIVDSKGVLEGLLHVYRRSEHCRDIVVLVSEETPRSYIDYLQERNYEYIVSGKEQVDYKKALEICRKRYDFKRVVIDSGNTLCGILLDKGLVDRVSLIISPVIVGKEALSLFGKIEDSHKDLKLLRSETMDNGHIHAIYAINDRKG